MVAITLVALLLAGSAIAAQSQTSPLDTGIVGYWYVHNNQRLVLHHDDDGRPRLFCSPDHGALQHPIAVRAVSLYNGAAWIGCSGGSSVVMDGNGMRCSDPASVFVLSSNPDERSAPLPIGATKQMMRPDERAAIDQTPASPVLATLAEPPTP
jgi:hypothetical protein